MGRENTYDFLCLMMHKVMKGGDGLVMALTGQTTHVNRGLVF